MESLVELLEQLIAIPSTTGREDAILDDLSARFTRLPTERASAWTVRRSNEGVLVTGRPASGEDGRPLVVLAGHVDTVPPQGDPGPRLEGDTMWGLGASDMKAGLAVMTHLGLTLDWWQLPVRLALVYYRGEEGPFEQNALGPMLDAEPWLLESRLAVLLEPTANMIELGCLGVANVEVQVRGEPCHSARPWLGRSALADSAPWILDMSRREPRERIVEGLSFKETMSITLLKAGTARNVLPGSLTANVNIRYAPDQTLDDVLDDMQKSLPRDCEWKIIDHALPGKIDSDAPLFRRFLEVVECPRRGKQGWTDVARFTARGVPALNFGPGVPEFAHRRDEQVPIENLEVAARWLRLFLETGP
jgi:succinyl-diaminopimelate desuccinylase